MRLTIDDRAFDDMDRDLEEMANLAFKKVCLTGLSKIVLRSPVDRGGFRNNWTVSIDGPAVGEVAGVDPSGAGAITRGNTTILGLEGLKVIYFTNNLPYARRLENGWSKQAPGGMVALTLAELQLMMKAA